MTRELLLIGLISIVALAAAGCAASDSPPPPSTRTTDAQSSNKAAEQASPTASAADAAPATESPSHDHGATAANENRVPAFEVSAASLKNLPPTLPPNMFTGQAQQAYQAAREIPKTLAQLPCYCHCDKGFGHKSLHSCYVDNHASMCAVCVDEALMAYRLQKDEHLKPAQIRERIIAQYSAQEF